MRPHKLPWLLVLPLVLCASCVVFAAPERAKKIEAKFHSAYVDTTSTNSIQISYSDVAPKDNQAISSAVRRQTAWSILVDNKLSLIGVQNASIPPPGGIIYLQLTRPLGTDAVSNHHISILFAGDPANGVQPEAVEVKQPKGQSPSGWFLPKLNFTANKKDANLDVSGSLQTGVGTKPQYEWNVAAQYPIEHDASTWIFFVGPKFTGIASQETNADPDSFSARLAAEFDFPMRVPVNFFFDPVDYEFERKPKQEAVLTNGKPTLHNYQQKNTNLVAFGQVQFVEAVWPVNVNINLGTEFGSAISRSVLNQTPKQGYSDNPLRALAGADLYFDLPKVARYPFLSVDGHYTLRLPFHPEPFKEAGVNNGNEFYSTKPRHYIAVNLTRAISRGSNFIVQYRYGSLPPTFSFVDHQMTIGFEVVLGK